MTLTTSQEQELRSNGMLCVPSLFDAIHTATKPYEEILMYLIEQELRALRRGVPQRPYYLGPICELDIVGDLRKHGREIAAARDVVIQNIAATWNPVRIILKNPSSSVT